MNIYICVYTYISIYNCRCIHIKALAVELSATIDAVRTSQYIYIDR